MPRNVKPFAAGAVFLLQKIGGKFFRRVFLEKGHDTQNTVSLIAAAGEGAPDDGIRHFSGGSGGAEFLLGFLCLGNGFNLLFHGREQGKLCKCRLCRRRNGGLFARRLLVFLIYL